MVVEALPLPGTGRGRAMSNYLIGTLLVFVCGALR